MQSDKLLPHLDFKEFDVRAVFSFSSSMYMLLALKCVIVFFASKLCKCRVTEAVGG